MLALGCAAAPESGPPPRKEPTTLNSAQKPNEIAAALAGTRGDDLAEVQLNLEDGLSRDEVALLAVLTSPRLAALRAQRGVVRAEIIRAGLLPNPVLSGTLAGPIGGGATEPILEGDLTWEITALLGRSSRQREASLLEDRFVLDLAWEEWRVAMEARVRFSRALYLKRMLEIERRLLALREHRYEQVRRQVELQRTPVTASFEAQQAVTLGKLEVARLERERGQELLELRLLTGLPPGQTALHLQPDSGLSDDAAVITLPAYLDDPKALIAQAEQDRLDLRALAAATAASTERSYQAALSRFPRISLGPFLGREAGEGDFAGVELAVELPLLDRGQAAAARARAEQDVLAAERAARVYDLASDIYRSLAALREYAERLRLYTRSLLPDAGRAVHQAEKACASGLVDALAVNTLKQQHIEAERERARVLLQFDGAWLRLETACGRLLNRKERDAGAKRVEPAEGNP
jgi:cobalt-zinc-cadmium efflux system outer membrane protein